MTTEAIEDHIIARWSHCRTESMTLDLKGAVHLADFRCRPDDERLESYLRSELHRAVAADCVLDQTEVDIACVGIRLVELR